VYSPAVPGSLALGVPAPAAFGKSIRERKEEGIVAPITEGTTTTVWTKEAVR